jgi:hypothetical protein
MYIYLLTRLLKDAEVDGADIIRHATCEDVESRALQELFLLLLSALRRILLLLLTLFGVRDFNLNFMH